ncbi:MAG: helix-turn-helix domain-containing protein [Actinomycetota bacterium]
MESSVEWRAGVHAALGDPLRLAMVEDLAASDRASKELADRFGLASNLLAHHLDVLESAGLIERFTSAGDRRRRYVRLLRAPLAELVIATAKPIGSVLFVCTHNSARSQLAAALWRARTGRAAESAGTHPARAVHPGAVAAARRAGLELGEAAPAELVDLDAVDLVITVCDRAHEDLEPEPHWWHWSIPDPVGIGTDAAFDAAVAQLDARITTLASTNRPSTKGTP